MPIIEAITALILTGLEFLKGRFGVKIAKTNETIRSLGDNGPVHAIGFVVPDEPEEDYDV